MAENRRDERQKDDFWDISELMPPKAKPARQRDPSATEAVEIVIPPTEKKTETDEGKLNISLKGASPERGFEMSSPQPDEQYSPAHPLISNIKIYYRQEGYRYYEQFLEHATKIDRLHGGDAVPVPFFSYVPQFSQLTKSQLDWYLCWREKFYGGEALPVDYSYILLFIYEIINTGGHGRHEWGQQCLCNIWLSYRNIYPRLDRLLSEWICDYSMLYRLPPPTKKLASILGEVLPTCTLKEFYISAGDENGEGDVYSALLTYCSNYNYHNSKFATGDAKKLYDTHIPAALSAVCKQFRGDSGVLGAIGLERSRAVREAYAGALCSFAVKRRLEVEYSSFARSYELRFTVTDIVKYIENKLRAYLGIKSRLGIYSLSAEIRKFIDIYFDEVLPRRKKPETEEEKYEKLYDVPHTPVSIEQAEQIETLSWQTTEKLVEAFDGLSEEAPLTPPPKLAELVSLSDVPETKGGLAGALSEHIGFLKLVDKGNISAQRSYASERGEMIELIVDKINEISVDIIGDIVIEEADGALAVVADYRKEIFND